MRECKRRRARSLRYDEKTEHTRIRNLRGEKMNVTYKNPGCEYSIESIMLFQPEEQSSFWSEPLLYFYPQIDKNEITGRDLAGRKEYLFEVFSDIYRSTKDELDGKVVCYNEYFSKYRSQIEDALSDAFELDARSLYNDLTGNITLNPICPRFLKERRFDVFCKSSEKGALGMSLHEIIHYFWFYVWNGHFGDSYEEYEMPSLKWMLSEMVVEALMSDRRLSSVNPYFPRENGGCVYSYFQDMMIDRTPVLKTIDKLYHDNGITDFMEAAYAYCAEHEQAIRQHIGEAENAS